MRFFVLSLLALSLGTPAGVCGTGGSQHNPLVSTQASADAKVPQRLIEALFMRGDDSQLWAVGDDGAILSYMKSTGIWKVLSSDSVRNLYSVYSTRDGSNAWAVGEAETVLHYSSTTGVWRGEFGAAYDSADQFPMDGSEPVIGNDLTSIYGSSDGSEIWAVGDRGTIVTYSQQANAWKVFPSGTKSHLRSVFGTADGREFWSVGWGGTILHFTKASQHWQRQASGTTVPLRYITGRGDGTELWAVGNGGTILHFSKAIGTWRRELCPPTVDLVSLYRNVEGSKLIATAENGMQFQYSPVSKKWESISSDGARGAGDTNGTVIAMAMSEDGLESWKAEGSGEVIHISKSSGHTETVIIPNDNWTSIDFMTSFAVHDGSEAWATGNEGQILHYSKALGGWRSEVKEEGDGRSEATERRGKQLFGNAEGTTVWYLGEDNLYAPADGGGHWTIAGLPSKSPIADVEDRDILRILGGRWWYGEGNNSNISHYLEHLHRWEEIAPFPNSNLDSIVSTASGSEVWAIESSGSSIAHFPSKGDQWELQPTAVHDLRSLFVSIDGKVGWSVGAGGGIAQLISGMWYSKKSGTLANLEAICGSHDATELWAVGEKGVILHYTARSGEWQVENGPFLIKSSTLKPHPQGFDR